MSIHAMKIDLSDTKLNKHLVSVIIPTYNSTTTIETCIKSILKQSYKNIEIIVVDNYSKDDTVKIANKLNVRIYLKGPERSSQRNYGAAKASGEYLLFIDSDMELTLYVIEECVSKCEKKNIDALIIPEISFGEGYWAKCKGIEKKLVFKEPGYEAVRFIHQKVFEAVGGYDEYLILGEDYDLHYRIEENHTISRINSFIRHNEGRLTIKKIISKYKYYAKTMNIYANKQEKLLKNQISFPRLCLKKWKILAKNPILLPGWIFITIVRFLWISMHSSRAPISAKGDK